MITRPIALTVLAAAIACGCSWDYPVWFKNKKSDTPLFRFVLNEKGGTGYIDREGKVVIPPTLSTAGNYGDDDFFEGLAKVTIGKEDWYIDSTGKPVVRAHYLRTRSFSEGLASLFRDSKVGYFNREGTLVIPLTFDAGGSFSERLAVVVMKPLYGYINKDGSYAIEPKFLMAMPFSEGAARVVERGPCLYIGYGPCDSFNRAVLPRDSSAKPPPSVAPRCRYSFIDKSGARLFVQRYPDAKDFAEGLAPVGDGKKWGYVDKQGNVVISFRYENAEPFSEGLARVRINEKWGFIDKKGAVVIPAEFIDALDFSEGMAVVGDGAYKHWFIDKTGRQAIPYVYTAASNFVMGRAHVRVGVEYEKAQWSYIDHTGRAVFTYSHRPNAGERTR